MREDEIKCFVSHDRHNCVFRYENSIKMFSIFSLSYTQLRNIKIKKKSFNFVSVAQKLYTNLFFLSKVFELNLLYYNVDEKMFFFSLLKWNIHISDVFLFMLPVEWMNNSLADQETLENL